MSEDLIKRYDAIKAVSKVDDYDDGIGFEVKSHCLVELELVPSADRPKGEVNAIEVYEREAHNLEFGHITLGEFNERIEPLKHLYYDRPKGEWARRNKCEFRCSVCGKIIYADCENERNYCPNCGSKNRVNIFLKWDDCPKAMGADMRGADDE